MTRARQEGPVELWLTDLVNEGMRRCVGVDAHITSVDVSPSPGRGELRAYVTITDPPKPDRGVWQLVAEGLCSDAAIERVIPVPPSVYLTLAPGVLEAGLSQSIGQSPLSGGSYARPTVVVFCSPNTNKPLHIGHLRACLLGTSMCRLLEACGIQVAGSQMLSNFGVHMCQALAMYDGAADPTVEGMKGDHFVGDLYRGYHDAIAGLPPSACDGFDCADASEEGPCLRCRPLHLLRRMAEGDAELLELNERLGSWAIDGITRTQARIGTVHDSCIREAGVIGLATQTLAEAVDAGICARRADGSTYIPIRSTGDSELTLLRRDGTSLVFSMLLGVYLTRAEMYPSWDVMELTGEQWRAGRTAMYEVLERIGRPELARATEGVFFGMVRLQGAVMRSRSGSVVTADELLDRQQEWISSWDRCPESIRGDAGACDRLGVASLTYHVLKFPRRRGFSFDEDLMRQDVDDRLGPVISALEWARRRDEPAAADADVRVLALTVARHPAAVRRAVSDRDPAVIVRYIDELADVALATGRSGFAPPVVADAVWHTLVQSLALVGINAADLGVALSSTSSSKQASRNGDGQLPGDPR